MEKIKFIYWHDENMWIGFWEDYPDYRTQGESLEELKENLKDIFLDVRKNLIPNVRYLAEMEID